LTLTPERWDWASFAVITEAYSQMATRARYRRAAGPVAGAPGARPDQLRTSAVSSGFRWSATSW
jgi:hypothetical protein